MRHTIPTISVACLLLLSQAAPAAAPPASPTIACGKTRVGVERFLPKQPGRRPAVILLHGLDGMKDGKLYHAVAKRAAANGYVAVIVHYFDRASTKQEDLPALEKLFRAYLAAPRSQTDAWRKTEGVFKLWLEAVEAAVAYARKHDRVDADRVALIGFSVGGFSATTAAARSEGRVRCVGSLFGGLPQALEKLTAKMPPALLIHGDADKVVPVSETTRLVELLDKHSRECEKKVYKGVGHAFERPNGKMDWFATADAELRVLAFLSKHLKQDKTRR